jgi:dipeptidyl aminopeptidase/acylaminoacyl peptidase
MCRMTLRLSRAVLGISGLLGAWTGAVAAPADLPQLKVTLTKLAPEALFGGMARVVRIGKQWAVSVNGVEGKPYLELATPSALFTVREPPHFYLGKGTYEEFALGDASNSLVYSRDFQRVAYVARKGSKWVAVVDGVEGPEHDQIAVESLVFSPDGKRVAYRATRGGKFTGKHLVVVDGVEGKEYGTLHGIVRTNLVFSPDGKRLAYIAPVSPTKVAVVVDGAEGQGYLEIQTDSLVFSPNGARLAYAARTGTDSMVVVVDSVEGKKYRSIVPGSLRFSGDSAHLFYAACASSGGKRFVVMDGAEWQCYDEIRSGTPVLSPDGLRVGFAATLDGKNRVVVAGMDGKPQAEWPGYFGAPEFSPDGKRVAFWSPAGKRDYVLVVDGVAGKQYQDTTAGSPVFSPDSAHVAYAALSGGKWLIVVDGAELAGPEFERGFFSMNGQTLIFDGPRHLHAIADGAEGSVRIDIEIAAE